MSFVLLLQNPSYAFSPYSNRELDELEKEFVTHINVSPLVLRDPLIQDYIHQLGARLAYPSGQSTPDFFIVTSPEINAFAGPGGHIGINTQLILASDNESELAGVMAHEMAHVRLHHLYRLLEHQKQMKIPMLASLLAAIALGALNPAMGTGALMATLGGFAQQDINFIRSNEKEADRIGIDILHRSGLDPRGMAHFFKKMQDASRYYDTAHIPAILRTHPMDADRIAEADNRTASMPIQTSTSSLHYALFKELVRTTAHHDEPKQQIEYYDHCLQKDPGNEACQFGQALSLMRLNRIDHALTILTRLHDQHPHDLIYLVTLARAQNIHHPTDAMHMLQRYQIEYPNERAILNTLAESYLNQHHADHAVLILLKAFRLFPKDLSICESLAQAQAASKQTHYAYFTAAQCQRLQGKTTEAKRLLHLALKINPHDDYLKARIEATLDELSNG